MTDFVINIHNVETGEEIEREATAAEIKQIRVDQELAAAQKAEAEAKEAARQSALEKLAALGLTEAEIQALAGQCEH